MDENEGDSHENSERFAKLGFKPQKEIIYNRLLPYWEELDEESIILLSDIKENLAKAVLSREIRPGVGIWTSRLIRYIKIYGLKFSKEDHVAFIHLVYELCTIPQLDPTKVSKFATLLTMLLKKKKLLSRSDLVLQWRPLYKLYVDIFTNTKDERKMYRFFSPNKSQMQPVGIPAMLMKYFGLELDKSPNKPTELNLEHSLKVLICLCKHYFPIEATQEILDEFMPLFCPFDLNSVEEVAYAVVSFLPTTLPIESRQFGYELWFNEFMQIWNNCNYESTLGQEMLHIMANLATQTVGYIDWEPYIPIIFSRILRSFGLPVGFKQVPNYKKYSYESTSIAMWIVSVLGPKSSAQKHLENFISTLETYLYPANSGAWVHNLRTVVSKLPQQFVHRVSKERYRKLTWENKTPEEYKLTDEDITKFVLCMKPLAMQTMFSNITPTEQTAMMQHLALLRPSLIIPSILEKMYATLDSLTEPHKLTSCLVNLGGVALPLVKGFANGYPEGPTHVIPLLFATLPGIDPNDFRKSVITSHFISIFAMLVPIMDSSKASEFYELTEEEHIICEASAGFEDFMLQYLDKVFLLVEASTHEAIRLEQRDSDTPKSRIETLSELTISSTTSLLLIQTSADIFKSALRKLFSFISNRTFVTKVAGQFASSLCKSFSRINGAETLKVFMPYILQSIRETMAEYENFEKEEKISHELLYHMTILSAIVDTNGVDLLPYLKDILPILDRTLLMNCRQGSILASITLQHILLNLSNILINDYRSTTNINKQINEYLPVRDWGFKPADVLDANLQWHVPNEEEIATAKMIIMRYLPKELNVIEKYANNEVDLTREEVLRRLNLVTGILCSAGSLFPLWQEKSIKLIDSVLPERDFVTSIGIKHMLTMPNGDNIRKTIVSVMDKLQKKLLSSAEDDVQSLIALTTLWDAILFRSAKMGNADHLQKNFRVMKDVMADKLTDKKRYSRHMIMDKVSMQHEFRMDCEHYKYTPTHSLIVHNLLDLSTSHYSAVRKPAQVYICKALGSLAYSYLDLLPKLVEYLQIDSNKYHEKFKGVLYVLLGIKQKSIMCKYDWTVISKLWPALLKSMPSEKPSVINLIDYIRDAVNKYFPTITITIEFHEKLLENARNLLKLTNIQAGGDGLTFHEEEISISRWKAFNETNLKSYHTLVDEIITISQQTTFYVMEDAPSNRKRKARLLIRHWRYVNMSTWFLKALVHPSVNYPKSSVTYFLQQLICDSLERRKLAMRAMILVLEQQKRKHTKIIIDPYEISNTPRSDLCVPGQRPDNAWLQYDSSKFPKNQKDWDDTYLLRKSCMGYYKWPKELEVYAPFSQQPNPNRSREELNEIECEIYEFFIKNDNVDKLIKFLKIEERKGLDRFVRYKCILFKALFRNFGTTFLERFIFHLEQMVVEQEESSQRAAAELLSGIIRGSKHWSFEMIQTLQKKLTPIVKNALSSMMVETVVDWGICFATAAEKQDPRRQYWLLETLMEDPLRDNSAFIDCGRFFALQGALNQGAWRCTELINRLIVYMKPWLNHPFQNVRERLASVLVIVTDTDIVFPGGTHLNTPRVSDMIKFVLPQLNILQEQESAKSEQTPENNESDNKMETEDSNNSSNSVIKVKNGISGINLIADDRAVAMRLAKTVLRWIYVAIQTSQCNAHSSFYLLLPLACRMENSEQDSDLAKCSSNFIAALAQAYHPPSILKDALDTIEQITSTGVWWSRCNALDFMQVMVFHSMSSLLCEDEYVQRVLKIVLGLLEDTRLEVREKAGQVLGGLLHCNFIVEQEQLLDKFIVKSKTKLRKLRGKLGSNLSNVTGFSEYWEGVSVRTRHTAVLGMCAFISAFPYDVPHFMPDVFAQLGVHLNDPEPIPSTIRRTLGDFKRTHHDNWETHKLKFTEEQLAVLGELVAPPSYYV